MSSWLFLGTCAIAVAAFVMYGASAPRGGFGERPRWCPQPTIVPPVPVPRRDRVVWESVSMRYALHRTQCVVSDGCVECQSLGQVLAGLLTHRPEPDRRGRETFDQEVARVLGGHVPDEAGLCRACVGGRAGHSCHRDA